MSQTPLDFDGVVNAWRAASEKHIHPLWEHSQNEYWESGRYQADQAAEYADKGAHIVDFGCGNGRLTIPLAQKGFQVSAVDSSPEMLKRMQKNAARAGVTVTSYESDGTGLHKQLKKKADLILARAVLIHHDYDGVARIVTELASCLKKGGFLMCDWPISPQPGERDNWIGVTTWNPGRRRKVATEAGLMPVAVSTDPTVWRKA